MNKEEAAVKKTINVIGKVVRTMDIAGSCQQTRACMEASVGELLTIAEELETDRYDGSVVVVECELPLDLLNSLGQVVSEVAQSKDKDGTQNFPELPSKIRALAVQLEQFVQAAQ